jgi:hypothetical protein
LDDKQRRWLNAAEVLQVDDRGTPAISVVAAPFRALR